MMLSDKTGQQAPNVDLAVQQDNQWQNINTGQLFAGKTVVLFSLPGAYTPTCSSSHLPRFNELASAFKANGVDIIACISVNDTFVMNQWAKDQEAENILMLPDGNGDFTEQMGMLVDKSVIGFGKRSWRYSMLVKDAKIEKMFIEADGEGDPFEVSDADTMLKYINAKAELPKAALMFSRKGCPHCERAKDLLTQKGIYTEEVSLSKKVTSRALRATSGQSTTPQIFIDGVYIGSADDLEKHFANV